jgi:competence protein ComEC
LTSFFAILGTLPLVMFYFNQISLVGLLANVMVVPLVGFLVVPLGLLSVFLYPLTVSGASLCIQAGIAILTPALRIVDFFSALPLAAIKTITPSHFEICCYYILFWAVLNLKSNQGEKPEAGRQEADENGVEHCSRTRMKEIIFKWKPARMIFFFAILAFCADAGYWLHNRFWHNDLRVTIIDVGHGNAALLELPGGVNILIDGGGFSDNSIFDVGARIIAPLLWRKKIKTVDTLVLSHPNSDHLNGLTYIADNFNVKGVWSNNEPSSTSGYKNFMDVIEKNKISLPLYKDIFGIHNINGVRLEIIYPPIDFFDKKHSQRWRNINNNSLVVRVSFGYKSFLFPGDIKTRAEEELVSIWGDRLKSTVLLAPHHGSRTSSTKGFLGKIAPEIVIISSGWNSRFKFPHLPVLRRYRDNGCQILVTARHGAIIVSTDGKVLRVKSTIGT